MKCKPKKIIIYIILIILTLIYILPFLWMINVSLKTNQELMTNPFSMPEVLQLGNYIYAWVNGNLGIAMLNSFIVCSVSLILSLTIGSMAAFAIARMKWKLSEWTLSYFLFGMMIPVHCVLIPLFVQFSKLGLTDSLIGLIIPYTVFALPMVIFLMTGFFKIAAPLTKTGFSVAGMMIFVSSWNELLMALVFISDVNKKTLPVTLTYFVGPYAVNYVQMFAAIIIALAPTIIVYLIFSNQIVEGLTTGAVKG